MGKITIGKLPEVNLDRLQESDNIPIWNSEMNTTHRVEINDLSDTLSTESIENSAEEIDGLDEEKSYIFIAEQDIQNQERQNKIIGLSSQQFSSKILQQTQETVNNIATEKIEDYIQQGGQIDASNDSVQTIYKEGEQIPNNYDLDNYINIGKYYKQDVSDQNNTFYWKMKVEQMAPNWIRQSVKTRLPLQSDPSYFSQDYRDIKIENNYSITSDTYRKTWKNYYTLKPQGYYTAQTPFDENKDYYIYDTSYIYTKYPSQTGSIYLSYGNAFNDAMPDRLVHEEINNLYDLADLDHSKYLIVYKITGSARKMVANASINDVYLTNKIGTSLLHRMSYQDSSGARMYYKTLGSVYGPSSSSSTTIYLTIRVSTTYNNHKITSVNITDSLSTSSYTSYPYCAGRIFIIPVDENNNPEYWQKNEMDQTTFNINYNPLIFEYQENDEYILVSQTDSMNFNTKTYYENPSYTYSNWYQKFST